MNEQSQDVWFFSKDGERFGPVAFSELRAKAQDATLDPLTDLVWTHGMNDWKPAGAIEGLFEKRFAVGERSNPYLEPTSEAVSPSMIAAGEWPGARRRSFLFMTIVFPMIWYFLVGVSSGMLTQYVGLEIMGAIGIASAVLPWLVAIYFGITRLMNLGMSRWWYLANFVPLLNIWLGYRCFACPAGYAYHKKLDGVGVFLAICYWLLVVIGILAMVACVAVLFGALGNSELLDQIRDAMSTAISESTKP